MTPHRLLNNNELFNNCSLCDVHVNTYLVLLPVVVTFFNNVLTLQLTASVKTPLQVYHNG